MTAHRTPVASRPGDRPTAGTAPKAGSSPQGGGTAKAGAAAKGGATPKAGATGKVGAAPKAGDGRSARRVDTKAAILDAAGELFATRGVSATSMEDIAEHAGIAKGSLYYNFTSKSGLVAALLERSVDRLGAAIATASAGLSGRAARRAVVAALLAEIQAQPHAARLMAAEVFRTDRDWRTTTAAWRGATMGPVAASLQAEEPALSESSAAMRAAAIVGAALSVGMEWQLFRPELAYPAVLADALAALALD
ncbi:MAG: TetR/AcrR family transcriptional regulator [Austwickia sp.]|jgi:AcrR family transcriptional regulator|nr:MAG: TetR/AcrR family transcriptional regulator [Austwickia sp.]